MSPSWELWAPPLAPPADGGLPYAEAEAIASAWWDNDPHLCGAPPMGVVRGDDAPGAGRRAGLDRRSERVSYGQATPGGDLGAALARASWHRSFTSAVSVPLRTAKS